MSVSTSEMCVFLVWEEKDSSDADMFVSELYQKENKHRENKLDIHSFKQVG